MAFGYNSRSPQDVQYCNGTYQDFQRIKERYEQIKPIRGKRSHLDIRPNGDRARAWERIVKVNDNEYYLTNMAHSWFEKNNYSINRAITYRYNEFTETETIVVHTPRQYWGSKPEDREKLYPKGLSSPSSFYFYNYNLPRVLSMEKFHSKNYLKVETGEAPNDVAFYTLDLGDVTLTRAKGEKYYKPLVVHREIHRKLDRTKTKAIRNELNDFKEYVRVMLPLAEAKRQSMYSTPLYWAQKETAKGQYVTGDIAEECIGKGWRGLFTGEPNELWFKVLQFYKNHCSRAVWNKDTRQYVNVEPTPEQVMRHISNGVYAYAKPLIEEPVELGKRTFDKYRSW